ncbi:unnamed protein product [Owenia fusiformis]|uniref:Uncharacterized protein n=1 Tax=Owenia fusiformis TaxID=6347 RepID=A0A8S4MU65_OWEFU|nr:unnamed protein product [Owenia fusiformis]
MQAKKRYVLLASSVICLGLCYYIGLLRFLQNGENLSKYKHQKLVGFMDHKDFRYDQDLHLSARHRRDTWVHKISHKHCRMETCFDMSKCKGDFKVYLYPQSQEKVSSAYSKILTSLQKSRYYTTDPAQACVFVLSIDTLDRDHLSKDYIKNIQSKIESLGTWNNGRNHLLFNLYSGTWPDYVEDLGFDIGEAMLAKASIEVVNFRSGFDISIPLWHKEHPQSGAGSGNLQTTTIPSLRTYTLVFKGKRYLTGIGSETRNSLFHLHNGNDIILLTSCRHGKDWQDFQDKRCATDNAEYDKYDYKVLLHNSTFCLVPRGRRLGSFRFLEALQAGCVPVLLSNGWELPFSEIINWNKAVVWGDERLLFQIPSIVRSMSHQDILSLQQQTQLLWDSYFASIDSIVDTTLEILKDRVMLHRRSSLVWNSVPGGLSSVPDYSDNIQSLPFYYHYLGREPGLKFTAVVYATNCILLTSSPLYKLLKNIGKSQSLDRIIIIWHCDTPPPPWNRWPLESSTPIHIVQSHKSYVRTISARFIPYKDIQTEAVLSLDEDALLTTDEVDFAFSVWREFPERIVGYPGRNHYWSDAHERWAYTSKWTNDYSMVLTSAAFIHRYYLHYYSNYTSKLLLKTVNQLHNCEDILMNFVVSHLTKQPPIKVTQRKLYKDSMAPGRTSKWLEAEHFNQRQICMNTFVDAFGYVPLKRSSARFDPLLYKDPVANFRKKYKQIEAVVS